MQVLYQLSYTPKGITMLPVAQRSTEIDLIQKSILSRLPIV